MALQDANLRSYLKFDEASGDPADSIGTLALTNNGPVAYAAAKIGNGADLESSGADQWFEATDANSNTNGLDFATDFSVSVWLKFESFAGGGATMTIFSKRGGGNGYSVYYDNDGADKHWVINIQGTSGSLTDNGLSTGTFYHMVFVYTKSAGTMDIYRNASQVGTVSSLSTSITGAAAKLYVGWDSTGGARFYDGIMDEMGFWARALSGAEITRLYNAGTGITTPFEQNKTVSDTVTVSNAIIQSFGVTFIDTVTVSNTVTRGHGIANTAKHSATWINIAKS